jgi:hypothetical protein
VSDCSHATITEYPYCSRAAMTCEPSRVRLSSLSVIQPNICQSHCACRRAYAYEVLFDDGDARVSRHFARLHRHSAIIRRWMGTGLLQPVSECALVHLLPSTCSRGYSPTLVDGEEGAGNKVRSACSSSRGIPTRHTCHVPKKTMESS